MFWRSSGTERFGIGEEGGVEEGVEEEREGTSGAIADVRPDILKVVTRDRKTVEGVLLCDADCVDEGDEKSDGGGRSRNREMRRELENGRLYGRGNYRAWRGRL